MTQFITLIFKSSSLYNLKQVKAFYDWNVNTILTSMETSADVLYTWILIFGIQ